MDATTAQFLSIVGHSCDPLQLAAWFEANESIQSKEQINTFLNETYPSPKETPLNLALSNGKTNGMDGDDNFSIVRTIPF